MLWVLLALVSCLGMLAGTGWWMWRARADGERAWVRPPPPQGLANLADAEYDFVELEIWEERLPAPDEPPPP